jgi:hypothetical protein
MDNVVNFFSSSKQPSIMINQDTFQYKPVLYYDYLDKNNAKNNV